MAFIRDVSGGKFAEVARETTGLLNAITSLETKWLDAKLRASARTNRLLTNTARSFVMKNYQQSGVESRSGKLAEELANVVAILQIRDHTRPQLTVRFRKGVGDYAKDNGGGGFYQAAAAVSYGAVRQNQNMNALDKRTAKKKAAKMAVKEGKAAVIDGLVVKVGRESKRRGVQKVRIFQGASVTQPKNFFQLTSSQKSELSAQAMNLYLGFMMQELKAAI